MKKILAVCAVSSMLLGLFVFGSASVAYADTVPNPAYTNYSDCLKLYKIPYENLYALSLSAVNAHKFNILEMQSRNGYTMFEVDGKEYLMSVLRQDKNYSYLKIAPADNNYHFSPTIPLKIFNYVDANISTELKEIKF